ncbi:helix-turn-helix domain-containing protein [Paraburkholderia caledonica]|uniref:helix-turn-helix domain-containing protein n=1 Tax=Paraburkholderia caledonica TaxID=134536 RepID=UPI001FC9F09F|nr:helix-turn-helix domain-containing protein [Paraburkholderia caledonica]
MAYSERDLMGVFFKLSRLAYSIPRKKLYVSTRRMQCRACDKTFSEALPDVDEKRAMTRRLADWIGKQAVKRTFASIADEVGVVEGTVRSIFHGLCRST